jgi:hypothetical protein
VIDDRFRRLDDDLARSSSLFGRRVEPWRADEVAIDLPSVFRLQGIPPAALLTPVDASVAVGWPSR